ncbi:MAG: DUF1131 family protein [Deltaproteobacteria bacterium]|nr:DUF1131 family protein [Deltaproteobacteria bacterium]
MLRKASEAWVILLLIWSIMAGSLVAGDRWSITHDALGPIEIRMPLEAALRIAGGKYVVTRKTRMQEGNVYPVYEVQEGKMLQFLIEPSANGKGIERLDIRSPDFRTSHGIGVGSTLADVRKAFSRVSLVPGDGGQGVAVVPNVPGYSFVFAKPHPAEADTVTRILIWPTNE